MYTSNLLSNLCRRIWLQEIGPLYGQGVIANSAILEQMWAYTLSEALPEAMVWSYPAWKFNEDEGVIFDHLEIFRAKQQLKKLGPACLCVSVDQEIVMLLEVGFAPRGFVDYRASLKRLLMLHQLRAKAELYLQIDPLTGETDRKIPYAIAQNCLLVYAVIAKQGAMALDQHSLRREFPEHSFPDAADFLLLSGIIKEKDWSFGV